MVSTLAVIAFVMQQGALPKELQRHWQHGRRVPSEIFILDLSTNLAGGKHVVITAHENGTVSEERVQFSGSPQFIGGLIETPGNGVAINSPVSVWASRVDRNVFGELRGVLSVSKFGSDRRDYDFLVSGQFLFLDRRGIRIVLGIRHLPFVSKIEPFGAKDA